MTPRTVKRAMARLRAKGYVRLVRQGKGKKANVYTLGSVTDDTTLSEVVTPVSISGDMGVQKVVTPASPLSMTLSEEYPRIERNRSAEGDAMPGGPAVAALGQRQPDKGTPGEDMYPDFWAAYPLKAGVRNAELKLGALINAGADYAAILAGARRYAEYCRSTKQVRRSAADAWLDRESWRDEWSAPKSKEQSNIVSMTPTTSAKPVKKAPKKKSEPKPAKKAEVIRLTPKSQKAYEAAQEENRAAIKEWQRQDAEIDDLINLLEDSQNHSASKLEFYITNNQKEKFNYLELDQLKNKLAEWQPCINGRLILQEMIEATERLNEWKQRKHEHRSTWPKSPDIKDFF